METILHLKAPELNTDFFRRLMLLLSNDRDAEITISYKNARPRVMQKESRKEYTENLNLSIENLEHGRNTVTFTGEEFRLLTKKLLKK